MKIIQKVFPGRIIDTLPYSFEMNGNSISKIIYMKHGISIECNPDGWYFDENTKCLINRTLNINHPYACKIEISNNNYREYFQQEKK